MKDNLNEENVETSEKENVETSEEETIDLGNNDSEKKVNDDPLTVGEEKNEIDQNAMESLIDIYSEEASKNNKKVLKKVISVVLIFLLGLTLGFIIIPNMDKTKTNEFDEALVKLQNTISATSYNYYGEIYFDDSTYYDTSYVITVDGEKIKLLYDVNDEGVVGDSLEGVRYDTESTLGGENTMASLYLGGDIEKSYKLEAIKENIELFLNNEDSVIDEIVTSEDSLVIKYNFFDLLLYCHNNYNGCEIDEEDLSYINDKKVDNDTVESDITLTFKYDEDYLVEYSYDGGSDITKKVKVVYSEINEEHTDLYEDYYQYIELVNSLDFERE